MENSYKKISIRQVLLLFIILFCAPAIRYLPLFTSENAKQAAWLSPFVAFVFELIYVTIIARVIKKYSNKSFVTIIQKTLGKFLGNIICMLYFLWITLLLAYNVRMYGERISMSVMPNINIMLILVVLLLLVGYVIKKGIVTIGRMGEMFFYILALIFIIYNILILSKVDIKNLFPITYKDTLPVVKASFGILTLFAYNILIFMFNDKIEYKVDFKKISLKAILIITFISFMFITIPICVLSYSVVEKIPIPYLSTMREISIIDTIERIEGLLIIFWVVTDFVLATIFTYSAIHILKILFSLPDEKVIYNIYLIGIFFLSIIISNSLVELQALSEKILTQMNLVMGIFLPIIIAIVNQIKEKMKTLSLKS